MHTAIDSNVILAPWSIEPTASRMAALLRVTRALSPLTVAAPVWTELHAAPGATPELVNRFLDGTGIEVDFDLDERVWRRASEAFAAYAVRRHASAGGEPKRLLVDFLVGAHARERTDMLLTLDPQRYRQAFDDLRIEP